MEPGHVFATRAYDVTKMYGSLAEPVWALGGVTVGFERARFTAVMTYVSTVPHANTPTPIPEVVRELLSR